MRRFLARFCFWSSLLVAGISAQDNLDPWIARLNSALTSDNGAKVRTLERELLSASAPMSTLLAAGDLLAQHDKMQEAADIFERCSLQYPASFEAKYNLALARIALTKYKSALEALNSISPVKANEKAPIEYLTGKIFLATNHLKEAQRSLASAYAQSPQEKNYALDLALLYIRSAAYVQAIEVLRSSLSAHPKSEDLALELALSDALAGKYSEATDLSRKLEAQEPALSVARLIAAFAYCAETHYSACEKEASAGLAGTHPNPYLYYLRARAEWDSGATDHAHIFEDISAAIKRMPECEVCLLLRSRMYEASQDDNSAIADLKKAVERNTQDASAWYRLAALYRKEKRLTDASDALQHYRSIHDDRSNQEVESFRKQFLDGDH